MTQLKLVGPHHPPLDLAAINDRLAGAAPETVLGWARDTFNGSIILTSSFGADSALMLHLVTRVIPRITVVFLDTGYLFPETYRFAEELTERFQLDVRVYTPRITAARQEALYGKLWEGDQRSLDLYHHLNKVEPMERALEELQPAAWIAGLRRGQTAFRAGLRPVERQGDVYKVYPILGFTEEDVHRYMRANDLPYHPLRVRGYRSLGDIHTTTPTEEGEDPRAGRHLGIHRECALHLPRASKDDSLKASGL